MDFSYKFYNFQINEWMSIPFYRGTDTLDRGDLLVWMIDVTDKSEECRLTTMLEF